ncbi:MAG: hypothetical protein ACI82A_003054 [Candidatus Azotimanducaceae bacterium]|jgi:hypothetical protein
MANLIRVAFLSILLTGPMMVQADQVEENPDGITMMGDLLVARPLGLVLLGLGTVTYVATLPFSLLGGNAGDAGKALVLKPAEEVLLRCLGCRTPGRKEKISN